MAETSRRIGLIDLRTPKKWRDRESSPDPIKIWRKGSAKDESDPDREIEGSAVSPRVPVLYYLSLNGQLQHPHFIEVPLSSSQGLYLRDFINQLEQLRGKGLASIYSWSSKRRYKNGFVWHDLSEDDLICPTHGNEYILKGSEILDPSPPSCLSSYPAFSCSGSPIPSSPSNHSNSMSIARRRNQSLNSIDFHKYRAYRAEWMGDSTPLRTAADASTQTGDWRSQRSHASASAQEEDVEDSGAQQRGLQVLAEHEEAPDGHGSQLQSREELSKEEVSPPPLDSSPSPETLVTLMKSHRGLMLCPRGAAEGVTDLPGGGRLRASSLLLQLISCGSLTVKDSGGPSYSNSKGAR